MAFGLSMSTRDRRLRIVNCGDFCGDLLYNLAHLATSQFTLPQLLNCLNLRGLQSFCLPFNNLAKSVKMVSGTRGRRFKSSQARHSFSFYLNVLRYVTASRSGGQNTQM